MAQKVVSALKEGDAAPEIQLQTDSGELFTLSGLKGKTVVLYFYPKADTPGCITEACEFRDSGKRFPKHNAVIVGVSPDTPAAQAKFKAKYNLPFTLLADVDKAAAQAYDVWKEKSMYGKTLMGIERSTFLIGPDGRIKKIFRQVKTAGHAAQVLEALSAN
jgi:peroxiredoxin Q/BCP